jgi:hypothetical protein
MIGGVDAKRRIQGMRDRFEHPEKHQADADTRCEQHREPAGVAIAGFGVQTTKTNPAKPAECDEQTEQHEKIRCNHEQPVESRRNPDSELTKRRTGGIDKYQRADDEANRESGRNHENRVVNIQPQDLDIVLSNLEILVRWLRCSLFTGSQLSSSW